MNPSNLQKKSNVCVITFYDGPFSVYGDLAWKSIEAYAERHGYDKWCFHERSTEDRPTPWEKIVAIQKTFEAGYEFVFWVDADAVIVERGLPITSFTKTGKDFFMVRHSIEEGKSPNLGVVCIRNTERAKTILSDIWNMRQYIQHQWWEQAAFIDYFGIISTLSTGEQELFKGVDHTGSRKATESVEAVVEWIDAAWNCIPHINKEPHPIIKHYAGTSRYKRLRGMIADSFRCGYITIREPGTFMYYGSIFLLVETRLIAAKLWHARYFWR